MIRSFLFLFILSTNVFAAPKDTLEKIKESGVIVLGHRESSIPFSYYDDQQNVVGFAHDIQMKIVEAVKKEIGLPNLKMKMIPVTSQNRIPLVQNGTVDLECGSTTNSKERQNQVAFSNSFFVVGTRLLTKKDSGIQEFSDLKNKNVVTTAGTTSERMLRKMNSDQKLSMNVISAKDHGEAFLTLQSGRAAAFMMDDALLYGELAKAKNPTDWVVTGTPQSKEAYGCMMRKNDLKFKTLVDQTIASFQKSDQASSHYEKWFMSPIPPKNLNLKFPMSEDQKKLYQNPNDKALE